jgi:C-terminal processing protease CtpA/Prc
LIIDIRGNGGGSSEMGDFIMKYISEREVRSFSKIQMKVSEELLGNPGKLLGLEHLTRLRGLNVTVRFDEKKQQKPDSFFNGKVYLLVDNETFSSASDFAAMFRDYECGKILGYETGGLPACFGEVVKMTLANSGVDFGVSSKKFFGPRPRPGDDEHGILPDIPMTEELLSKFKTGDPVLSFAVDYVKNAK